MVDNLSLMIATPAHNGWVHIDHKKACLSLLRGAIKAGIEIDFVDVGNQVTKKARNSMISYFYENKKYTHYIHLDADVGIATDCIPKLLKRNVDVIGVPVPLAGYDEKGNPVLNIGEILNVDETGLAETTHVGNAVLMFNRKAVTAIIEDSAPYDDDPQHSRGQFLPQKCYDVFLVGVMDGIYRPEDYSTCYRLRKLGFKIHLDLTIPVKHNKMHPYATSLEVLEKVKQPLPSDASKLWGAFAIEEDDWTFIKRVIINESPHRVLEFGCGLSTFLIARSVKEVVSYEANEIYGRRIMSELTNKNIHNVEIRIWDGMHIKEDLKDFDLVFVDGPIGQINGGLGREHSIKAASGCADQIIIHDAKRAEEVRWQDKYIKGNFKLMESGGKCNYWSRAVE